MGSSQLKKWKNSLQLIQVVLADAGQKHITQKPVELWLHDLQDLAYDIDDVLDDMCVLLSRVLLMPLCLCGMKLCDFVH